MRLNTFFIAATAALTVAACAKDGTTDTKGQERAAKVKVKLVSPTSYRGISSATVQEEQEIENFVVFLFKADGTIDGTGSSDGSQAVVEIDGTTAAASVYVLVNTGEIGVNLLSTITTKAQLMAASGALMKADHNTPTQTGAALWMSGGGVVSAFSSGEIPEATADVDVYFVAAKITVIVDDKRTNNGGADGKGISITDNKIVLLFAGREGVYFEKMRTTPTVQSSFYTGDATYPDPFAATLSTALSKGYATEGVSFYTFANGGSVKPTILAIQSTKTIPNDPDDIVETIYYPAHFTINDLKHTVLPGREYVVTLQLNGDIGAGGGGGTTDPEEELRPASVTVTVTVKEWIPITAGKIF